MKANLVVLALLPALAFAAPPARPPAPRPYDAVHYRIDVRLREDGSFDNKLTMTVKPRKPLTEVELDSFGLTVRSAKVGGAPATFTSKENAQAKAGTLTVKAPAGMAAGKDHLLEIEYSGKAGVAHEGLFTVKDPEAASSLPHFYTHFEPNYAQRFFPCNDRPDDKATTEVFAVVPDKYQVLSNGTQVLDEAFAEGGENLRRTHWKEAKPHPTYAVAIAVGKFEKVDADTEDVPAKLWVLPGKSSRTNIAEDFTRTALDYEARYLGVKYPWEKYDQVAVPQFLWGGMENTSLVFMRENGLVLENKNHIYGRTRQTGLIAHELAHQWFGNFVTCSGWNDTWLNEGFASYLGTLAEEKYYGNDYVRVGIARDTFVDYFREEDGPRSHPLVSPTTSAEDLFDDTSYLKGAQVLRMLEVWLGREEFKKGLKAYLEAHAYGNATSDDFFTAMTRATKKDLRAFKESWLKQRGYPVLVPEMNYSGGTATVTLRQRPNHAGEKGHFVFKLPIVFHRESEPKYSKAEAIVVDKPQVTVKVSLPAAPEWVNWNQNGSALAKVHSGAIGEQQWVQGARQDPDPVWRLLAHFVLLGEIVNPDAKEETKPSDTALSTVLETLTTDPSPYVREAVMARMSMSKWKKLPSEFGPVFLALAKRPDGLTDDPLGYIRVRRAAIEALGKVDFPDGRKYLLEEVQKPEVDLNYLPAFAVGTARLGDSIALATLNAAVNRQKGRGYAYYKAAAGALGAVENPEVVKSIRSVFREIPGNNEFAWQLLGWLEDNHTVKSSPEGAAFVSEFVIENSNFGDELKDRLLRLLDEVKTEDAKKALAAIVASNASDRLKEDAKQVLDQNFPAPKVETGTKGKKR